MLQKCVYICFSSLLAGSEDTKIDSHPSLCFPSFDAFHMSSGVMVVFTLHFSPFRFWRLSVRILVDTPSSNVRLKWSLASFSNFGGIGLLRVTESGMCSFEDLPEVDPNAVDPWPFDTDLSRNSRKRRRKGEVSARLSLTEDNGGRKDIPESSQRCLIELRNSTEILEHV